MWRFLGQGALPKYSRLQVVREHRVENVESISLRWCIIKQVSCLEFLIFVI
jgi:hypothetical protein